MAQIPVEKKSGGAWWMWLLALLVIGLGIWLVVGLFDTDEAELVAEEPVEVEMAEGPVTQLAMLYGAANWRDYIGRDVQLTDMYVTRVTGDSTFFVRPASSEAGSDEVLVELDQKIPANPANVEGRYDVTEGQMVAIPSGSIQELTEQTLGTMSVRPEEVDRLRQESFYILAQRLNITEEAGN